MNQITIIGAPTAELEPRTITTRRNGAERTVLDTRIVVPRGGKDDPKDYFPVTFFGKTAEIVARYSGPGKRLGITGRLELQTWGEGDDRKYKTVIIGERVNIIDYADRDDDDTNPSDADGDAAPHDRSLFVGSGDHAAASNSYPEIAF